MAASLPARFLDAFLKSFTRTLKELSLHALVLLATFVYWGLFAEAKAHFWEITVPLVWAVCFEVAWHLLKAAYLLNKEVSFSLDQGTSTIVSQYGDPFELPMPGRWFVRFKTFAIAGVGVIVCLSLAVLVGELAHSAKAISSASSPPLVPVAIVADCKRTALPVSIAPQSTLHLVSINRKFMLARNWGLADIPNQTDEEQQWPSKQAMQAEKAKENFGVFGYKCDLSNHSRADVLDAALTLKVSFFGNKGGEGNTLNYTVVLSPLDAGSHFIFYVFNDCPGDAAVVLPESLALTVVGEAGRRTVPLHLLHRSPLEPFMVFTSSTVQVARLTPCE